MDELCPLDERRTTRELLVKLAVVHFTTISAYCHVSSIRGEPILGWRLFFFILEPLSVFVHYAVAALILVPAVALFIASPAPSNKDNLATMALLLFGRTPVQVDQLPPPNSRADDATLRLHNSSDLVQPRWKLAGRLCLASVLLLQCVCTILQYRRRTAHHAVTLIDQRILELGCSCIPTAMVWAATVSGISPFRGACLLDADGNPPGHGSNNAHRRMQVLALGFRLWIGQLPLLDLLASGLQEKAAISVEHFLTNSVIALVTMLFTRKLVLGGLFYAVFRDPFLKDGPIVNFESAVARLVHILVVLWVFLSIIASLLGEYSSREGCGVGLMMFPFCLIMGVATFLFGCAVLAFFLGFIPVLVHSVRSCVALAQQIKRLEIWPVDKVCPLLWSDPAANWMWALA